MNPLFADADDTGIIHFNVNKDKHEHDCPMHDEYSGTGDAIAQCTCGMNAGKTVKTADHLILGENSRTDETVAHTAKNSTESSGR